MNKKFNIDAATLQNTFMRRRTGTKTTDMIAQY